MKPLLLTLTFAVASTFSFSQKNQYDNEFMSEFFYGRQPSARAEALGKSYVSMTGDLASVFYNPAGIAALKGPEINGSYASPYYQYRESNYSFLSLGYRINRYISVGVSRNEFNDERDILMYTPSTGQMTNIHDNFRMYSYTLTLASEPVKNLFVGANFNYLMTSGVFWDNGKSQYFDLGAAKRFDFPVKGIISHKMNIAASLVNVGFADLTVKNQYLTNWRNQLPVTARYGVNYQFGLDAHWLLDSLETVQVLCLGEFQDLLNSEYRTATRLGMEVTLLELLSLRMGYFWEKGPNKGMFDDNYDGVKAFTYGAGIQLPLHKLTKVPLNLRFDYARMPQPLYSKEAVEVQGLQDYKDFSSYSLKVTWMMK